MAKVKCNLKKGKEERSQGEGYSGLCEEEHGQDEKVL
jgi:hypothetical protein